jgi:hypothetical protein
MNQFKLTLKIALLAVFVTACGGGGGSAPATQANPGSNANSNPPPDPVADPAPVEPATVAVILTDASINDYDKALATITSIELIGDNGHVQVFSGSETVDFLALADFVEIFAVDESVTPDTYEKIRLRLADLTLVNVVDGGDDIETHVDLVANGKVDLNPQGSFTILPGQVVFVSIDFDMEKSVKLIETGSGKTKMRPVIFANIGTKPAFKNGLARVHGVVDRIAVDGGVFSLCMTQLISRFPPDDGASIDSIDGFCLTVRVDEKTGLFGKDGLPILASDLSIGQELTVVGIVSLNDGPDGPTPRPLPVEADEPTQLPEDDCDDDDVTIDDCGCDDDDVSIDGTNDDDCDDDGDFDTFLLNAIVVEAGPLGTWTRLRGQLKSPIDDQTGLFGLFVFSDQGFPDDTVLTTQVFEKTRIYRVDDDGLKEISAAELMTEDIAALDGVLIPGEVSTGGDPEDLFRTALMLTTPGVSVEPVPEPEVIRGKILTIDAEGGSLMVATAEGDVCVDTDDETLIFEVFLIDKVFESVKVMLGDLTEGNGVGIYGIDDDINCFAADLIIAEGQIEEDPEPN